MISIFDRARLTLDSKLYGMVNPHPLGLYNMLPIPEPIGLGHRQYILRMMIGRRGGLAIPSELTWLRSSIIGCINHHDHIFPIHPFIYITVRHGRVTSTAVLLRPRTTSGPW